MGTPLVNGHGVNAASTMGWGTELEDTTSTTNSQLLPETDIPTSLTTYGPSALSTMAQSTTSSATGTTSIAGTYSQSPVPVPSRKMSSPVASNMGGATMQPTWKGFIHTTRDGLVLLEACLQGVLSHIPRRPHDRERQSIISSGNIFIYEENASGIRRWTDGITWSPSRIMGNFLVYRELLDGHPPGEKKRAAKKRKRGSEDLSSTPEANAKTEEDRQLIGSLSLESYNFKPGGLAKKTLSVEVRGIRHHIISYYRVEDVKNGLYGRPTQCDYLNKLEPRRELVENPGFKSPVEDRDDKVNVMVSPQSQIQPTHHLQLVNAGVPVVVNVPQQTGQVPRSIPHAIAQHSAPGLMYQSSNTSQYQLPASPLDAFDPDTMAQYQNSPVGQISRHHYPLPQNRRTSSSNTPEQKHQPHPPPPPTQPTVIPHSPMPLHEDKRVRHEMLPHIHTTSAPHQALMYFDSTPISTGVEFEISSLPAYSTHAKYVDEFYHGNMQQHDFSHSPVYMLPQGQSFSG